MADQEAQAHEPAAAGRAARREWRKHLDATTDWARLVEKYAVEVRGDQITSAAALDRDAQGLALFVRDVLGAHGFTVTVQQLRNPLILAVHEPAD